MKNKNFLESLSQLVKTSSLPDELKKQILASLTKRPRRKLINRKEVLKRLSVSKPTLQKMIRRGLVTEVRFSTRKIRFIEAEIDELSQGYFQKS